MNDFGPSSQSKEFLSQHPVREIFIFDSVLETPQCCSAELGELGEVSRTLKNWIINVLLREFGNL